MKAIIIISVLLLGGGYWFYQQVPVSEDDIYVDRLVYLKKDSSLFTGTLKVNNPPHTATYTFCKGMPCESWEYRFKGDLVHKGERLGNNTLSANTIKLIGSDIFYLDYWQEGESETDPKILSVRIIKSDSFFRSDKNDYKDYFEQVANAVVEDTKHLNYVIFNIDIRLSVYKSEKMYVKKYSIEKGKPVDTGIIRE